MKRKNNSHLPTKSLLVVMIILCILLIAGSVGMKSQLQPLKSTASAIFVPMENGLNAAGNWISQHTSLLKSKNSIMKENEQLKNEIADLETELSRVQLDQFELDELRTIYQLDQSYPEYTKVAASVIGKDTGNWYSTFLINKGTNDGIQVGNNVLAGSGLVGIVTDVGPSYATVRSIIDDTSSVSSMILPNNLNCLVNGSLTTMSEKQYIEFSNLEDSDDVVEIGNQVVTSYISDRYLPGLPIGYIVEITKDSNQLTKSGLVAPIVDFEKIQSVMVILELKEDGTGSGTVQPAVPELESGKQSGQAADTDNADQTGEDQSNE